MTIQMSSNHKVDSEKDNVRRLIDLLYTSDLNTLQGLTLNSLDRVLPNSFIRVYATELIRLCKIAVKSQELYTANYSKWHSNDTNMGFVGKRIMPIDKNINEKQWIIDLKAGKTIDYSKYRNEDNKLGEIYSSDELEGIKKILVDVKTDTIFKVPKLGDLPAIQFIFHYLMNRRSIKPDALMETYQVLARAIEVGNTTEDGQAPAKVQKWQ